MSPFALRVEKLVPGGQGFARSSDGRVVLMQQVVPGDEVEVQQAQERKGFVQVERWRLLNASDDRVEVSCPVAARCGGCDWMMLSEAAHDDAKLALVREALARTGKIRELPEPVALIKGPRRLGYRSRIRLQTGADGKIGFFAAQSRDLVEVSHCAVADAQVNAALNRLRELAAQHPDSLSPFAHVEVRSAPQGPVSLYFVHNRKTVGMTAGARRLFQLLANEFAVCTDESPSTETDWQRYPLTDEATLLSPPGTFTQVNWSVNQLLIAELVRSATERKLGHFLELYCGSGNFTLPLLHAGFTGVAIENDAHCIVAARRAANEQRLDGSAFHIESVEKFLQRSQGQADRFDWILLDPPRAGIKQGIEHIIRKAPRHIAICSCDPVTLARDLRRFLDAGYGLDQITAFDMFPQTHHVETLTWLKAPDAP